MKHISHIKAILSALMISCILLYQTGCTDIGPSVTVSDEGSYYNVVLNFIRQPDHKIIGAQYGKEIKKSIPDFESLVDSYMAELVGDAQAYDALLKRVNDIKPQIPKEYCEEIEGMAEDLAGSEESIMGDNKLSLNELYLFNLIPDVLRQTQCCCLSVYGSLSETGATLTARDLDWYGGSKNQIPRLQAVITYKYKDVKVCSVGYMGYMGIITGFNSRKVFSAILDSPTGSVYDSVGKSSYPMDLRLALEKKSNMDEVARYMSDSSRQYTVNHLIALSDPVEGKILENNFSGSGQDMKRALRSSDSILNEGITWGIKNAVAAVNAFLLKGNHDNFSTIVGNTERWSKLKTELESKGEKVTLDELKSIISFDNNDGPGDMATGDLYNSMNQMSVVFQPATLELEVAFRPRTASTLPDDPVFIKIPVFKN